MKNFGFGVSISNFLKSAGMLMLVMLVSLGGSAFADTLTVDGIGSGGVFVPGGNYVTIQSAIDAAVNGDTVFVELGTYSEALLIDKPLTLEGRSKNGVIIDASGGSDYGIQVTADDVTLKKFTLQNATTFGVKVAKCSECGYIQNFNVASIAINNSGRSNLDLNGVENSRIGASQFSGTPRGVGIGLQNVNTTVIKNTTTSGNARGGIALYTTDRSGYPTDPGSEGVRIVDSMGDEIVELYTQQTDGILEAPTAEEFTCSVTAESNPDYVWYFKDRANAEAYAEAVEGVANCELLCGDNYIEGEESCDDGNLIDGDGCSNLCEIEALPVSSEMTCGDGSVYARVVTDFGGTMMVGPYAVTAGEWFLINDNGVFVEYANDNSAEVDGMFITQSDDGLVTIRHYGETTTEVTSLAGTLEFMNAIDVGATPETGPFNFETGEYADEVSVDQMNVNFLMYVNGGSDGATLTYEVGNEETLECPADPFVSAETECRDGSVYATITTNSGLPMYLGDFSLTSGQPFEVFNGTNFVEYTIENNEGVVISQNNQGDLRVELYGAETQELLQFDATVSFTNGLGTSVISAGGMFNLNANDSVSVDNGLVLLDIQVTTGNDGAVIAYEDTNGITVCEGDIIPVSCDDEIYGTLTYPGFVRSFILSDGFENEVVKINPVEDMVMDVSVKQGQGEVALAIDLTNVYPLDYSATEGGTGLESEENGNNHTDIIILNETIVRYEGQANNKSDDFSVELAEDSRCVSTLPFEEEFIPVCGDGTLYARLVSEDEMTFSLGEYTVEAGEWFPVFNNNTPVVYSVEANYGLVVAHTTPGQLEVYLLNDEVTNELLGTTVSVEFSNSSATSVTPMSNAFALEESDSIALFEGGVSISLLVTTGDDGVVIDFEEDSSCLEELVCDESQYAILCYYDGELRPVRSTVLEEERMRASCEYALFDLSQGYDDGTISVSQTGSGDVVFIVAADSGRLNGTLELINLDIIDLNYLMGGDGLESGSSFREEDYVSTEGDTVLSFNMFTSSGIDTLTIETTSEGVCEEESEEESEEELEEDQCEGEDLSGSTTDGECDAPLQPVVQSGGGRSSSVRPSSGVATPTLLLETGDSSGDETAIEEPTVEELMSEVDVSTISACNEDTYILERLVRLSALDSELVGTIPVEYSIQIGAQTMRAINVFMNSLETLSADEKNNLIRSIVCRIEVLKEARNQRHENIGILAGGSVSEYLIQYIQDRLIMHFDADDTTNQENGILTDLVQ